MWTKLVGGNIPVWNERREALALLSEAKTLTASARGDLIGLADEAWVSRGSIIAHRPFAGAEVALEQAHVSGRAATAKGSPLTPFARELALEGMEGLQQAKAAVGKIELSATRQVWSNGAYLPQEAYRNVNPALDTIDEAWTKFDGAADDMARAVAEVAPTSRLTTTGKATLWGAAALALGGLGAVAFNRGWVDVQATP